MGWEISSEVGGRLRTRFDDLEDTKTCGSLGRRLRRQDDDRVFWHLDKAPRGTRWVLRPRETAMTRRRPTDVSTGHRDPSPAPHRETGGVRGFVSARPRAL